MSDVLDCAITASFLDSGSVLANASHAAAVMAGIAAAALSPGYARAAFAASVLLWPIACWFAVRAAIDARLFRVLAENPQTAATRLDEILKRPPGRTIPDRCRGAMRLWRRLAWIASLQLLTAAAAVVLLLAGL